MSRRPLSPGEAALWQRLISTVEPLKREKSHPVRTRPVSPPRVDRREAARPEKHQPMTGLRVTPQFTQPDADRSEPNITFRRAAPPNVGTGLDGHWDRRFTKGNVQPDATVDLHGHTLQTAYARLDQALAMGVAAGHRVILLVTGKAPRDGSGRGVIRAAVHDWLASSRHAGHIAGIRNAHPRHGGEGALYIILKRARS